MTKIKKIESLEILDSRGIPTIRTIVKSDSGIIADASVPSGSSTGKFEAFELRDNDERYFGKGVLQAVSNVNKIIAPALKGLNPEYQKEIDEKMIKLDGTAQKKKIGANAILSVSLAVARLASKLNKLPLYKYLNNAFLSNINISMPTPFSVVIEGGKHSSCNLDIQEFIIVPNGINNFPDKIRAISEIYYSLGSILKEVNVGLEGAFGPSLKSNTEAMSLIVEAIEKAGYSGKVNLALDIAASELYQPDNDGNYYLKSEEITLKKQQLLGLYSDWISNYPIISMEDGLEQEDWDGWIELTERFSKDVKIIGDDLFVTNPERIKKGIRQKAATGLIIKLNQIGTLSETIAAIKLARKADWTYIISHRSGETCDTFISDLAVSSGASFIKTGAPSRGERVEKYNRLLEIEKEIQN